MSIIIASVILKATVSQYSALDVHSVPFVLNNITLQTIES